jgi:hypothetical protein
MIEEDDIRQMVRSELAKLLAAALAALNSAGAFNEELVVPFLEGVLDSIE